MNDPTEHIEYRGLEGARPIRRMTEYETDQHVKLSLGEQAAKGTPCPADLERSLMQAGSFSAMIMARLNHWVLASLAKGESTERPWERIATPAVIMMVSVLEEADRPANAHTWAYTLMLWRAKYGKQVTLDQLSMDEFPHGFPELEAYRKAWETQKSPDAPNGNRLETPETWLPLTEIIFTREEAGNAEAQ